MDLSEDLGESVSRESIKKASPASAMLVDPDDAGAPGLPRSAKKKRSSDKARGRSLASKPPRGHSPLFRSSTALHILTGGAGATAGRKSPASLSLPHPAAVLHPSAFSLPSSALKHHSTHAHASHKPLKAFRAPPRSALELQRESLPIFAAKQEILQALRDNDTIVLIGETGSGKTTQVPQYLLSSGQLGRLGVCVTQPRRVAAISVSTRVAEEVGCALGSTVGYLIRFEDVTSASTRVTYVTDGMLLRELVDDPLLTKYNTVVLDEAHERTVNTDVLFALLRKVQAKRKKIVRARKEQDDKRKHERKAALDAASRSPHRSPHRSPSSVAAAGAAASSSSPFRVQASSDSPDMRPLDLATDQTPPLSKEERKQARQKRRREKKEREQGGEGGDDAAPPAAPAPAAAPTPAARALSLAIDSDDIPPLHSIRNLAALQELKLVVMSATLAAEQFASYFSAPVLTVPGRTFPVELLYAEESQPDYVDATVVAVMQVHLDLDNRGEGDAGQDAGDILVFLTGSEEIESVRRTLEEKMARLAATEEGLGVLGMTVLPLYASLPSEAQLAVFVPARAGQRKVVLSTNVAETSLTIPGIKFVVDSGVVKQRMYSTASGGAGAGGMEVLKVVDISQAEANQRSGRAGRDRPGVAFRLYTESAFASLRPQLLPEILRSNLTSVVLNLKALGVGNVLKFEFITPPSRAGLTRALEELYALKALNYNGELSELGRRMVNFPLPPAWARMLLQSSLEPFDCAVEVTKILSVMSVEGGVFVHVPKSVALSAEGKAAAAARRQYAHTDGDHFTYLDAYNAFLAQGLVMNERGVVEWCRAHGLHYKSLVKARKIYEQLAGIMRKLQLPFNSLQEREEANEFAPCTATESIKKCLLFGLFSQVARKQAKDASYLLLSNNSPAYIHPSSVLIGKAAANRPELIVFNTLVHTSRTYMRECMVLPELKWLAELVPEHFGDGMAAGAEGGALRIKGGREQSELHARLAQSNANGSKLTAARTGGSVSLKKQPNGSSSNGQSSSPAQPASKKQKHAHSAAAAVAAPAAAAPSSFPDEPAVKLPKQKKVKKDTSRAGSLMDFINTM